MPQIKALFVKIGSYQIHKGKYFGGRIVKIPPDEIPFIKISSFLFQHPNSCFSENQRMEKRNTPGTRVVPGGNYQTMAKRKCWPIPYLIFSYSASWDSPKWVKSSAWRKKKKSRERQKVCVNNDQLRLQCHHGWHTQNIWSNVD